MCNISSNLKQDGKANSDFSTAKIKSRLNSKPRPATATSGGWSSTLNTRSKFFNPKTSVQNETILFDDKKSIKERSLNHYDEIDTDDYK
jgi:hypothetical protein